MSVDLVNNINTNKVTSYKHSSDRFDPQKFNQAFEYENLYLKNLNDAEEQRELDKENKIIREKTIPEMSFIEFLQDWKKTMLVLINNIITLNINNFTLTQDNTLFHLGFTILFFVIVFYFFYSFYIMNLPVASDNVIVHYVDGNSNKLL